MSIEIQIIDNLPFDVTFVGEESVEGFDAFLGFQVTKSHCR